VAFGGAGRRRYGRHVRPAEPDVPERPVQPERPAPPAWSAGLDRPSRPDRATPPNWRTPAERPNPAERPSPAELPSPPDRTGPPEWAPDDAEASGGPRSDSAGSAVEPYDRSARPRGPGGRSLLAAGLLAALARRGASTQFTRRSAVGETLRLAADVDAAEFLDRATRMLSAELAAQDRPLPPVFAATLTDDALVLHLAPAPLDPPPPPWGRGGAPGTWRIERLTETADGLPTGVAGTVPAIAPAPFPGLATVGHDGNRARILVDIEGAPGVIAIAGDERRGQEIAMSIAVELATNQWSDELRIHLIGFPVDPPPVAPDRLRTVPSVTAALAELAAREDGRSRATGVPWDGADATGVLRGRQEARTRQLWSPDLLVLGGPPDEVEAALLARFARGRGQAVGVVVVGDTPAARWVFTANRDGRLSLGVLGIEVAAQLLPPAQHAALVDLFRVPDDAPPGPPARATHPAHPARAALPAAPGPSAAPPAAPRPTATPPTGPRPMAAPPAAPGSTAAPPTGPRPIAAPPAAPGPLAARPAPAIEPVTPPTRPAVEPRTAPSTFLPARPFLPTLPALPAPEPEPTPPAARWAAGTPPTDPTGAHASMTGPPTAPPGPPTAPPGARTAGSGPRPAGSDAPPTRPGGGGPTAPPPAFPGVPPTTRPLSVLVPTTRPQTPPPTGAPTPGAGERQRVAQRPGSGPPPAPSGPASPLDLPYAAATAPTELAGPGEAEIRVLGRPAVYAPGPVTRDQIERLTELLVFLALHPDGAHPRTLAAALGPGDHRGAGPGAGTTDDLTATSLGLASAWLGTGPSGHPRLVTGTDGRLRLGQDVRCDWWAFAAHAHRASNPPTTAPGHTGGSTTDGSAGGRAADGRTADGRAADGGNTEAELAAALGLVTGPLFADLPAGRYGWLRSTGLESGLRTAVVDVAHRLAERSLRAGDTATAMAACRTGLRAVPAAEPLWRDLLRTVAARGDRRSVEAVAAEMYRALPAATGSRPGGGLARGRRPANRPAETETNELVKALLPGYRPRGRR